MRFNQETRIVLLIPATFINDELSPGLKRGGVLNIVRREVELLCSPLNIPGELVFDLEGLDIGDAIHIGATELPEDVATTTDRDFTVATISAPTLMPSDEEEAESEEGEEGMDGEEGVDGEVVSEDTAVPDPSDDGANSND
jgi:large subunit ribosomal protein L25